MAYTQYAEVSLDENVDLIVSSGDDFIPDILGLSTTGIVTTAQEPGRIRAGSFAKIRQELEHHNSHLVLRFQLVMD